jgi:Kdo2-lipid IVA lauroyltransferase/acyltransferase
MNKQWSRQVVGRSGQLILERMMRRLAGCAPHEVHQKGEKWGAWFGRLVRPRHRVVMSNLELAFPELSAGHREDLANRVFAHFGRTTADFLSSKDRTIEDLTRSTDFADLLPAMDDALSAGRGALLVSGHLGNWERISAYLSLKGYPLTVVIRDANQEGVNQLVNSLRESTGTRVLPRGQATRPMLERLRGNEIIGILCDQNADDAFMDFFGKPAGMAMGLGVLAERTKAPVVPAACMYLGNDQYRVETGYPFQPIGENSFKGEAVMRGVNHWLEGTIRAYPDQWLWMHDRWRAARERGML